MPLSMSSRATFGTRVTCWTPLVYTDRIPQGLRSTLIKYHRILCGKVLHASSPQNMFACAFRRQHSFSDYVNLQNSYRLINLARSVTTQLRIIYHERTSKSLPDIILLTFLCLKATSALKISLGHNSCVTSIEQST